MKASEELPPGPAPAFNHGFPANPYNPHAWIVGEPVIGENCWIGAFTLIDGQGGLKIGNGVDISSGAQIITHSTARRCVSQRRVPMEFCPTTIEDYVFVGTNAVVLMGCQIGHHSIIAAGAVVVENTTIPPYSLVAGVPARVIRNIEGEVPTW